MESYAKGPPSAPAPAPAPDSDPVAHGKLNDYGQGTWTQFLGGTGVTMPGDTTTTTTVGNVIPNAFADAPQCTGGYKEDGLPRPGTKCVGDCVNRPGKWGASYCWTTKKQAPNDWGGPCVPCQAYGKYHLFEEDRYEGKPYNFAQGVLGVALSAKHESGPIDAADLEAAPFTRKAPHSPTVTAEEVPPIKKIPECADS